MIFSFFFILLSKLVVQAKEFADRIKSNKFLINQQIYQI